MVEDWKYFLQQLALIFDVLHLETTSGHFGLPSLIPKKKNKRGVTLFSAAKKLLNKCNVTLKRERAITGNKLIQRKGKGRAQLNVPIILYLDKASVIKRYRS